MDKLNVWFLKSTHYRRKDRDISVLEYKQSDWQFLNIDTLLTTSFIKIVYEILILLGFYLIKSFCFNINMILYLIIFFHDLQEDFHSLKKSPMICVDVRKKQTIQFSDCAI